MTCGPKKSKTTYKPVSVDTKWMMTGDRRTAKTKKGILTAFTSFVTYKFELKYETENRIREVFRNIWHRRAQSEERNV